MTRPANKQLTDRYQVIKTVVSENPYSTAKELEMYIVKAKWVTVRMKRTLNYPELMRRLNECCDKGDRRECNILKSNVTTWIKKKVSGNVVHPRLAGMKL